MRGESLDAGGDVAHQFSRLMFTEAIKRLQERYGSREAYARQARMGSGDDVLSADEIDFIQQRDSFYIASQGENGWPYIQHRGGPKGFLKVIDAQTLAFADFAGNRQYVTTGNVGYNGKVSLFLMDYPRRTRLKILGIATTVEPGSDPQLDVQVAIGDYPAKIERIFKIKVVAFDWNCQQHITPRFTADEIMNEIDGRV